MSEQNKYDVVIIGSGIGGLTAACLLSKSGLKVAVVEKEPHAGGYLAGYQHKGFRFDTAIHWLNQCSDKGVVAKIFGFIGKDHPVCEPQKKIHRYKGDVVDFLLTDNPEELKQGLINKYPEDEKGIVRFFKAAKKLGTSFHNFSKIFRATETMNPAEKLKNLTKVIKFALPFIPFIRYDEKNMKKGLQKFFTNPDIHNLFSAETDLLSCLVPIGWAYYKDYQHPPQGGGQVIPEWLVHVFKTHGGDVFFNASATEIIVENNTAKGLKIIKKGEELLLVSDAVIAACDLETVYKKLLPEGFIPKEKIQKLNEAEIYASSLTVSIALNCPTEHLGFGEEMIHLFKENIAKELHNSGDPNVSALTILAPSVKDKTLAPEGCGTLVVFMPAYMHQYNNWETDPGLERNESYHTFKNEIAEKLITRVQEKLAPEIRNHILFYDVATPVTHWRYTGNKFGSMMGAKPGRKNMQAKVAGYKTPVKNLYIGGQWAELGGGVPIATRAGANAALLVLKKQNPKAFKMLAHFFDGKIDAAEINGQPAFKPYNNNWVRKKTPAEKYF